MKRMITLLFVVCTVVLYGQNFTKISGSNPIATDIPTGGYAGASWVDYDSDGDIDLFVNQDFLYRNDGNGEFTRITDSGIVGITDGLNNGNCWGDVNNDGHIDLILANRSENGLFMNQGDGTFEKILSGDIAISLNAWSPALADYDNDGWLDLVATHPCGFTGSPCQTNYLFTNNGDGSFTQNTDSDVTTGFDAYTVANWSDFDDDGDMDLFIGSGTISSPSKDHIYINQLAETGSADLVRKEDGVLFGDLRDGQNWNFIDYDNDGDLDAFVTNFSDNVVCDFYESNGDGTFTKLTESDLQVHMASEIGTWLTNTWGDFNNDGWIDVFISADAGSSNPNHLYLNNGNGTFSHHFPGFTAFSGSRSASIGDYDDDGDLDLFINSNNFGFKGLYRNELNPGGSSDHNWINLRLIGTVSNRTAIGATVRIKAEIDGQLIWQRRDISSQNTFAGHNSYRVHFGLGDAEQIDSLIIEWPLGLVETYTEIATNQFIQYVEGGVSNIFSASLLQVQIQATPNPSDGQWQIQLPENLADFKWEIRNAVGQLMSTGVQPFVQSSMMIQSDDHWPTGLYFLTIQDLDSANRGYFSKLMLTR